MVKNIKENYFIITGAMGAGKSTILQELRKLDFVCIDEPARQILAEQRAIGGGGLPEHDPTLFAELLLSRSIYQFKQMVDHKGPVLYDRGIPDNISYANFFDLDRRVYTYASHQYQYNGEVFFLSAWEEIYQNDDERKMTFEQAKQFGEDVRARYDELGYRITDIPMAEPAVRVKFILDMISKKIK